METHCGLCAGLRRHRQGAAAFPWDQVLLESDHFAAVPTRGAIVPGWVLVVTKDHSLCMGAVPPPQQDELADFCSDVRNLVEGRYGPTATFEHGPASPKLRVGCGVDHAHLHIVPTDTDLLAGVPTEYPGQISWSRARSLAEAADHFQRGESYLFIDQPRGSAWIGTAGELPSQLFRKVIARAEGSPARFDWNMYPEVHTAAETVLALGTASPVGVSATNG